MPAITTEDDLLAPAGVARHPALSRGHHGNDMAGNPARLAIRALVGGRGVVSGASRRFAASDPTHAPVAGAATTLSETPAACGGRLAGSRRLQSYP